MTVITFEDFSDAKYCIFVLRDLNDSDIIDLSTTQFGVHNFFLARNDLLINPNSGIMVA